MLPAVSAISARRRSDEALAGIGLVVAGVTVFTAQDAAIKWLSGDYSVYQIVLVRSLVALLVLPLYAAFNGGLRGLRPASPSFHLLRGLAAFAAYTTYYLALAALPLAEAIALFFVAPLFITALSVPVLGESVGWRRWGATAVGFLGVLVMLRPGFAAFEPAGLLAIGAAAFYAAMQLLARRHAGGESGIAMAFSATVMYVALSGAIGLAFHDGLPLAGSHPSAAFLARAWTLPSAGDFALMALTGLTFATGFYAISQAYRTARPAVIACFEYLAVPLGALAGYLIWRSVPDAATVLGAMLVVGSGLYVLDRERRRRPEHGAPGGD